jgi:hypothetical protein
MYRRNFLGHVCGLSATLLGFTGCGTLIHGERCNRPHSNNIDWKMVALDSLGLLLFFIPGVVAFIVDFSTGAIYLPVEPVYYPVDTLPPPPANLPPSPAQTPAPPTPPAAVSQENPPAWQRLGLRRVVVPRQQLDRNQIEQVVAGHVGQPVSLADNQARLSVLPSLDQYNEQTRRHRADHNFGTTLEAFFSRFTA